MTGEPRAPTERWVRKHRAGFAYGYDPNGELAERLGVRGLPTAFLIDPLGTIVWKGHPAALEDETIEGHLTAALRAPLHTWPPALAEARDALRAGRIGDAVAAAKRAGPAGDEALPALRKLAKRRVEVVRALAERGDLLAVEENAARFLAQLEGHPQADELAELLAEQRALPRAAEIVAAQRRVHAILGERLRNPEKVRMARLELERLANENPGTIVARQVQRALRRLPE